MSLTRSLCRICISCLLALTLIDAALAQEAVWPERAQIEANQQVVSTSTLVNEAEKAHLTQLFERLLAALEEHLLLAQEQEAEALKAYRGAIQQFPKLAAKLRSYSRENIERRDFPLLKGDALRVALTQELLALETQFSEENSRHEHHHKALSEAVEAERLATARLEDIERQLAALPAGGDPKAPYDSIALERQVLLCEQKNQEARRGLATLRRRYESTKSELILLQCDWLYKRRDHTLSQYEETTPMLQRALEQARAGLEALVSTLPAEIKELLEETTSLTIALQIQKQRFEELELAKKRVKEEIAQVQQLEAYIERQAKWLSFSSTLGEMLRSRFRNLPKRPTIDPLERELAAYNVQVLEYELRSQNLEKEVEKLQSLPPEELLDVRAKLKFNRIDGLTEQVGILSELTTNAELLINEVGELIIDQNQLKKALQSVRAAEQKHAFWVPDVKKVDASFVFDLFKAAHPVFQKALPGAWWPTLQGAASQLPASTVANLVFVVVISMLAWGWRPKFRTFLISASSRIGKVTQDRFSLTVQTIFTTIGITFPAPCLMMMFGWALKSLETYEAFPALTALGHGLTVLAPVLWALLVCQGFSDRHGLFIKHFRWPEKKVFEVKRYLLTLGSVWLVFALLLVTFESARIDLWGTIGRLAFVMVCLLRMSLMVAFLHAGVPLELEQKEGKEHYWSVLLWGSMIFASPTAMFFAILGYLSTAKLLLVRLDLSLAIWLMAVLIYHVIRRWMLLQRRRLAFERAKQRRAEILAQRARLEASDSMMEGGGQEGEEALIDLDTISSRSLQLVRYMLGMSALICIVLLWSNLQAVLLFFETVTLWDGPLMASGVHKMVTLRSLAVSVLILFLTAQLVRNLPALLELTVLQHLSLSPGTGYTIITLTKYGLVILGGSAIFSLMGMNLTELPWLLTLTGAGIGFGMRQIVASFLSGLILLFTKAIRIGDTITSGELTGTVTRISTLTTTMVDWDRKEVLIPNHQLLNQVVLNWTLTDTITRVVLNVPAPIEVKPSRVLHLLEEAAVNVPQVLDVPAPEIFLLEIENGYQMYELRVYSGELAQRNSIRSELYQQIEERYREAGIPFPATQLIGRIEMVPRQSIKLDRDSPAYP